MSGYVSSHRVGGTEDTCVWTRLAAPWKVFQEPCWPPPHNRPSATHCIPPLLPQVPRSPPVSSSICKYKTGLHRVWLMNIYCRCFTQIHLTHIHSPCSPFSLIRHFFYCIGVSSVVCSPRHSNTFLCPKMSTAQVCHQPVAPWGMDEKWLQVEGVASVLLKGDWDNEEGVP